MANTFEWRRLWPATAILMNATELLSTLNSIGFSQRYWELCDRFPFDASSGTGEGRKVDVMKAFAEVGVATRYDSRDRSYLIEEEQIGNLKWWGLFAKRWGRGSAELMLLGGASSGPVLGGNFAVLAYEAMQLADPTFSRDRFSGPAPYPRPSHNGNPVLLASLVKEFVVLVRIMKDALRR